MSLDQVHRDAAQGATAGNRVALFIQGFASRIQNECNNKDFAAIRELCVQAAQSAEDIALSMEHGWDSAERMRREDLEHAQARAARNEPGRVAPSVDTPLNANAPPHAGPTDLQTAPTPETHGTVPAQPTTGERAQSAPRSGPSPGHAPDASEQKEQKGEPAGARTNAARHAGETQEQANAREARERAQRR